MVTLVIFEFGKGSWFTRNHLPFGRFDGAVIEFGFLDHYYRGLTTGQEHGKLGNTCGVVHPTYVVRDEGKVCMRHVAIAHYVSLVRLAEAVLDPLAADVFCVLICCLPVPPTAGLRNDRRERDDVGGGVGEGVGTSVVGDATEDTDCDRLRPLLCALAFTRFVR